MMAEAKITDFVWAIVITQVTIVSLKIAAIGSAANLTWLAVFTPTWLPLSIGLLGFSLYVLGRKLFPEKKKHVTYTSTRWQESLAEFHRNK